MSEPLLPSRIIEHLAEHQLAKHSRPTQVIYLIVIFSFIAALVVLPFLYVSVNVKSLGLLRPAIEISKIQVPSPGKVSNVFVSLNQDVVKGQKLVALDSTILEQQILFLSDEVAEDKLMKADLHHLLFETHSKTVLRTSFYKQALLSYSQKITDLSIRNAKTKRDYDRNLKLHRENVIADVEFENFRFELEKSENDLILYKQNQFSQWQVELSSYENEIAEHEAHLKQLKKEKSYLIIRAPIRGTIQNLASIQPESRVFANQEIAEISPDTNLIAETFVNPGDIGLLRAGMPVRFQVDAFNYNQWGIATGKVLEISNDINIINERPVFKVRCVVDNEYLQLKNGYKGYLKKGMTLQARFMVTERTLWQLLYDKMDDWLNPNTFNR